MEQAERRSSKIHCTNSKKSQHSAYISLKKYFTAGEDSACIKLDCLCSQNMQIFPKLVLHDQGKVVLCLFAQKVEDLQQPECTAPYQMNNRTELQMFNWCHSLNGFKDYLCFSIRHDTYFSWKKVPWWSTGSTATSPLCGDWLVTDFFRQMSGWEGLPVHLHVTSTLCTYKAGWKSATFPFKCVQQ